MRKKQVLLSLFGILLLMALLIIASLSQTKISKAISIPHKIGSYVLMNQLEGEEAIQHISQLHGKDIKIQNGYILEYQNMDQLSAVVWISESPNASEAKRLFNRMNKLMDQSKAFSGHQLLNINGVSIEYVFGMDMDNYYYQKGSQVIWISVPGDKNQEFIKKALQVF